MDQRRHSVIGVCRAIRGRDHSCMIAKPRVQQRYDHRLRDLVRSTGNIGHATRRGVPRSTARGWLTATHADVVTVDVVDLDVHRLQHEVLALRHRVEMLLAMLRSWSC